MVQSETTKGAADAILQQMEDHESAFEELARWLMSACGADMVPDSVAALVMIVLSVVVSSAIFMLVKVVLLALVARIVARTSTKLDDMLLSRKVLTRLAYVAPITCLIAFGKSMEMDHWLVSLYMKVVNIYATICVGRLFIALTHAIFEVLSHRFPRVRSLKSIQQLIVYIIFAMIGIVVVAILLGRSPGTLLAGLGASAALMSLVFKETIQSLVSGVQLTANDMLAPGDWIVVPKAGANGTVLEVNLNTVKIRNWDNTITTVPPSTLMQDSFVNWRGMQEGAGRRISRSLNIDMDTVRFISPEEQERFSKMPELFLFFDRRSQASSPTEPLTNLTLFREYVYVYLIQKAEIAEPGDGTNIRVMVRYQQPTQYGLPFEIYCFTRTKVWEQYEAVMADVTDHVIASLAVFGLRTYQVSSSASGAAAQMSDMPRGEVKLLD